MLSLLVQRGFNSINENSFFTFEFRRSKLEIKIFSIYQRRLLVDFEAEVKMTGTIRAKRRRFRLLCFFENKKQIYVIILVNTKKNYPPPQGRYLVLDI